MDLRYYSVLSYRIDGDQRDVSAVYRVFHHLFPKTKKPSPRRRGSLSDISDANNELLTIGKFSNKHRKASWHPICEVTIFQNRVFVCILNQTISCTVPRSNKNDICELKIVVKPLKPFKNEYAIELGPPQAVQQNHYRVTGQLADELDDKIKCFIGKGFRGQIYEVMISAIESHVSKQKKRKIKLKDVNCIIC
eukprot:93661_1